MSDSPFQPGQPGGPGAEWFAHGEGLAFQCTLCGNCCTGAEGYVLFTDAEAAALARRLNITLPEFLELYTHDTIRGRSLKERETTHGFDCVFLDRDKIPGKAVCGVYEDRPAQCRTWPFWKSNLTSRWAWERAKRTCPGMDKGRVYPVQQVRVLRDAVDI
ncbi:MAG TPA: YkgJ family cysteine cluster protein [Phycisphaerales bacterium]|nr:YkgJ family cysteine cluster protein [Phycisphaerales bacterium]